MGPINMLAVIVFVLYVAGLVVLLVATFPVASRINLVALGLFLIFLAILLSGAVIDVKGVTARGALVW